MSEYTTHFYPKRKRRSPRGDSSKSLAREKAWQAFSLYIRMRDREVCMMGTMYNGCGGVVQAGHVIPKAKSRAVYFDEKNVFGQCSWHNYRHSKPEHVHEYQNWYLQTFGESAWVQLQTRAAVQREDFTIEELRKIKSYYEHRVMEL